MSLFKKKVKKEEDTANAGIKKEYKVILKEKITRGTTRTIRTFDAGRWKDPKDGVVYLKGIENQKHPINFLEIFPDDMKNFVKFKKESILDDQILKVTEQLEAEQELDDPEVNQKNFEYELMKLEAQKRAFKYNNEAAYFTFGEDSRVEIYYLRDGSDFRPFKWDTDTATIYQPSEAKKKSVVTTLRNKEAKYKTNDKVTATAIILLIVGVVLTLGNVFAGLKVWSMYDESKIAELELSALQTLDVCSGVVAKTNQEVQKTAITLNTLAQTLNEKTTQPVIAGILPQ